MITIQLVKRLRVLHEAGYLHNDLKPDNILVGLNDPEVVYLIDFGSASKFKDEAGRHIKLEHTG